MQLFIFTVLSGKGYVVVSALTLQILNVGHDQNLTCFSWAVTSCGLKDLMSRQLSGFAARQMTETASTCHQRAD